MVVAAITFEFYNLLGSKLLTVLALDEGMLVISGILGSFFDTGGK